MKEKEEIVLKECPFCGGEAKKEQTRGSFGGYCLTTVYCQTCSANTSNAEKWNKRVFEIRKE